MPCGTGEKQIFIGEPVKFPEIQLAGVLRAYIEKFRSSDIEK